MIGSRPDLAYAISLLSKFNARPTYGHLAAAKRVLRYLQTTRNLALAFRRSHDSEIQGYTDSDWAGDPDDRKSTSGYVFTLFGAAISWKSKKQDLVALSSTEAEYVACSIAAKEAIWLMRLAKELDLDLTNQSQLLFVDNQGAIKLSENPRFHERIKHIDIHYHFVREAHDKGLIQLAYLPTADMTANIMTKPLPRETHWKHVKALGLVEKEEKRL